MKKTYLLTVPIIILCAFILSGCVIHISKKDEDKNQDESANVTIEAASFGKAGFAVDTEDASYYWEFTSDDFGEGALWGNYEQSYNSPVNLVCRTHDGQVKTVLSTEYAGTFAVTDKGIFYNNNDGFIVFVDPDSQTEKDTGIDAIILGVSSDGKYLIVRMYQNNQNIGLYSIDTSDYSATEIHGTCDFLTIHNDIVYYSPYVEDYEKSRQGMVELCRSSIDGKDKYLICQTEPDLYDYDTFGYGCSIAQMRFSDDRIYFSYGCVAGTGFFYQGGKIVKVNYDGSGMETIAGADGNLVGSEFEIDKDGNIISLSSTDAYHEDMAEYYLDESSILWYDKNTGKAENVSSYYPDENYYSSSPQHITVTDKHVYFITHYSENDPENAVGWREYYVRKKSVFYVVDRETKEIVTSYEF